MGGTFEYYVTSPFITRTVMLIEISVQFDKQNYFKDKYLNFFKTFILSWGLKWTVIVFMAFLTSKLVFL